MQTSYNNKEVQRSNSNATASMFGTSNYIKIIIVGAPNVGKTSLVVRYCRNTFTESSYPTIGADHMTIAATYSGQTVNMQLWDIAGQEKYATVSKLYMRNALACIVVCSADDLNSLRVAAPKWSKVVRDYFQAEGNLAIPMLLVQNKSDLLPGAQPLQGEESSSSSSPLPPRGEGGKEVLSAEEAAREAQFQDFALENGFFKAMHVSAKTGQGVNEAFESLLRHLFDRAASQQFEDSFFSQTLDAGNGADSMLDSPYYNSNIKPDSPVHQTPRRIKNAQSFKLSNNNHRIDFPDDDEDAQRKDVSQQTGKASPNQTKQTGRQTKKERKNCC